MTNQQILEKTIIKLAPKIAEWLIKPKGIRLIIPTVQGFDIVITREQKNDEWTDFNQGNTESYW